MILDSTRLVRRLLIKHPRGRDFINQLEKLFLLILLIVVPYVTFFHDEFKSFYEKIPLFERFIFIPWILLIYTYAICYFYEKIHDLDLKRKNLMTQSSENYHYTLYWIIIPFILHYYPELIRSIQAVTPDYIRNLLLSDAHGQFLELLGQTRILESYPNDKGLFQFVSYLAFLFAMYGVGLATRARIYLNGYWGLHLYRYGEEIKRFVDDGPYGKRRHPIYAGQIFLVFATAVVSRDLIFFAFAMLVFWMNLRRAKREEDHLINQFADYRNYMNRVGKIFGFLY